MANGKQGTLESVVAEIREIEKRKHITATGFAIVAIYKDHPAIRKVCVRPEHDEALCYAVDDLAVKYFESLNWPSTGS